MLQCPKCGRQFDSGAAVCPDDATPLSADVTVADPAAVDEPSDPLIGNVLDDKYRLDARLGEGGMGTVYRATHLLIERPVAVKVLNSRLVTDDAAKERFRREARAAGRLQHTNAVAVTDFGETRDGLVYLVMELLEGKSLREVLAREAPLDPARAVSLMLQISAAVEAAHEAGIIHRDLKPGNIFLVQRPDSPYIVKVLDFGIAKIATEGGEYSFADTLTGIGVMIGTPRYMSPEQCDGAQLTPASDVYSLGVILYEMLTGQTPFSGVSPLALALKHSSESPRPPRELVPAIPPTLEAVVLHALEKGAQERPADAGEFRRELFAVAERLGLEHSAGFSAPTIETLRDAGTETPSGRLVIDIERLRRSRAATQTGEAGVPTSDPALRDTSGRPSVASALANESAAAADSGAGVSDAGVASGSVVAASDVNAPGDSSQAPPVSLSASPAAAAVSTPDEEAREQTTRVAASRGVGRLGLKRGPDLRRLLKNPLALILLISVALLLVYGAVRLWRSPARRGAGVDAASSRSDEESDETLGRTLSKGDSAPRGSLAEQPRTASEFYENGGYFISVRSYDAAVRDLRHAVELQPDFPSAHNRLGRALLFKGQDVAAAEEFRKAVEQRGGKYPTAQYNLGFALQQQGERDKALAAYRAAIESRDGNYPDAFYQIGGILYEQGHWPESADAFRKAAEQNGGRDPESFYRLGVALVQQKDYAGAETAFRDAVNQRGGDFAFAHYNLGLLYQQTDRIDEAITEFETFLQQSPHDENRFRVENTLRDLRRRSAREGNKKQ
ncbi:MAG: eukaryotic-like serine/threonine-protein kinase [Acidobacteriota bacterium]|jgi:serine/threonine-protein kinase|nr:eukaryotic-like serine/threonine-protein kinase [Acidobacteriota bacterium]